MNRRQAGWLLAWSALALSGCATALRPPAPGGTNGPWSGRLALQVQGNASQSFAAMFELRGSAEAGELELTSPLGGTLAVLAWAPGTATLRSNGQTRSFASVDALATQATGAAIPVAALFDWLRGRDTPVPGWQANLSQLADGRISAVRHEPAPQADLRIALDR